MPALVAWIIPSIGAILAAWFVQKRQGGSIQLPFLSAPNTSPSPPKPQENAIFVIGDLHGDVECAKHWIEQTGLIDESNGKGRWMDPSSFLVFVGDYVDKGPTSKQTVELVKGLTEQYPTHVTALMGNHEMELLLDRDQSRWETWGGAGFFRLAYASAHPAEYLNYIARDATEDDEAVVKALYRASVEVYSRGLHSQVYLAPPALVGDKSILSFIPVDMRELVTERLKEYQEAYLSTYRSGTELGTWLESRPVIAQLNDTVFVHGGISQHGKALVDHLGIDGINDLLLKNAHEDKLSQFIGETREGQIIYDLLTFRGNHKDNACPHLPRLLPEGASRLGVGHTPDDSVRLMCDDNFLALDSALGRYFRNSGNEYCPGHEIVASNGRYMCQEINEQCEGQIVKITDDGGVEMIPS